MFGDAIVDISVRLYQISALFTAIFSFAIAVFVLAKNRKLVLNRLWGIFCLLTAGWSYSYYMWSITPNHLGISLFWNRLGNLFAIIIPPIIFHFALYVADRVQEKRKMLYVSYGASAAIFIAAVVFPEHFIRTLIPKVNFSNYPEGGVIFLVFFTLQFFILMYYSLYIEFVEFKKARGAKRNQIKYLWIGKVVAICGASTNFFPMFHLPVFPLGNLFVGLFPFIVAYSIIRYRLMEIDTVIHRTILWVLTSCSILIPIGVLLFFVRTWLVSLTWIQLTFITTGLFYVYLFYYRKTQPQIDHLFRRRKYDYYKVLGEIGQKIGSELDINNVVSRLFRELKEVIYIRNGIVLVQQPGQQDYEEIGSMGYEGIVEVSKTAKTALLYQGPLSQWCNTYQKAIEREQVEVDPKYSSVKREALGFFSANALEVLVPVIMESKVNALLGIGKKENLQAYTIKDVELLENMGRQIGITLDNALHHEDIVEKERLAEEMKLGREIQIALLPHDNPRIAGLTVQGLMQPAKDIGGDYYDFITVPDKDNLSIVIGDVSGKGVAAGLLMAMAKTAIHTLSQEQSSPRAILLRTNKILNQHIGAQKFMTMLYFLWESRSRTLTYSSAGHEHILVYRAQGPATTGRTTAGVNVESIISGGFMLGMLPDIDKFLEEKQLWLQPGDKILLYTDGVTEAENQAEDRFGLEKLIESFKKHGHKPANELMQSVKDEVYAFIGNHPQYDDITLVVLEAQ